MGQIQHWEKGIRIFLVLLGVMFAIGATMTTANPSVIDESDPTNQLNGSGNAALQPSIPITGLSQLPLSFVPNAGQLHHEVLYQVRGLSGDIFFTTQGITFALPVAAISDSQPTEKTSLRLEFIGANPEPHISPLDPLPGKVNYLVGNDPNLWHTNLHTYAGVEYQDLYPGIDLSYFGTNGSLKSTFTASPGIDPMLIRWRYLGAEHIQVDAANGDLLVQVAGGSLLTEKSPVAWQEINGEKLWVPLAFKVYPDFTVGFRLGDYDPRYPLILDPVIEYSSYIGGSSADDAWGIAADNSGNAYVVGRTESANFPTTIGAIDTTRGGQRDAFVIKVNTTASGAASLVWSTYLGGSGADDGWDIDVDSSGNAYITGTTNSSDFPTMGSAFQPACCASDVFLTKINSTGSSLLYSTFLGGSSLDEAFGVAVDTSGNAYLTGITKSSNFPTTASAYQTTGTLGASQIFVSKIDTNASGSASLVYSTYIDGNDTDYAVEIAADDAGFAFITGKTESTNFPVTASAYQAALKTTAGGDGVDAFILKLDTTQSGTASLAYSTYFGGQMSTGGLAGVENFNSYTGDIATNGTGIAYITGETNSLDLPIFNGYQTTYRGGIMDAFVAKFDTSLSGTATLLYSTYLGGNAFDQGYGIAIDTLGNAYLTGVTTSSNFPVLNGLFYTFGGFVTRIDTNRSGNASLISSTRLGGSPNANGYGGSAVDAFGTVYVAGQIAATGFTVVDGFQTTYAENSDGYMARLSYYANLRVTRSEPTGPTLVGSSHTYTISTTNLGNDYATNVVVTETLTGSFNVESAIATQGDCTYSAPVITCEVGNVNKNATVVITVTINPTTPGTINKTAIVDGVEIDTNAANNTAISNTNAQPASNLTVSKADSLDPVIATQTLTYTVTVTNNGPSDATDVVLTDTLPTSVTFISAMPSQGSGCNQIGSTITCNLDDLTVSSSATVNITVTPNKAGTISNTASAVSSNLDPNPTDSSNTIMTTVLPAPPAAPSLLTPAHTATVAAFQPAFTWNVVSGAVRYEILLDTNSALTAPAVSVTTNSFTPPGALLLTTYYWRVRAFNVADVPSEWSDIREVNIVSPANAAPLFNYYTTATPTLTWNTVTWATEYEIQVDNSSAFTFPLEFTAIVPATTLSLTTTALPEGTHFWRVRAKNGNTIGSWSIVERFLVELP